MQNLIKELAEEELEYYARQIVLSDINYDGQIKIKKGKVAIIGLGGLGSPEAILLASMGIGYLKIVDKDKVAKPDLHRQILYKRSDIGKKKVKVAEERLKEINPNLKIETIDTVLNEGNVEEIIKDVDVILDGLDNMLTRYIINKACIKLKKPYIFASAIEMFGNISTIIPFETACLECFYGKINDEYLPSCSIVGVHPSVTFITASIAVSEGLRIIMNQQPLLKNKLLYIDLRNMDFIKLNLSRNVNCNVCNIV